MYYVFIREQSGSIKSALASFVVLLVLFSTNQVSGEFGPLNNRTWGKLDGGNGIDEAWDVLEFNNTLIWVGKESGIGTLKQYAIAPNGQAPTNLLATYQFPGYYGASEFRKVHHVQAEGGDYIVVLGHASVEYLLPSPPNYLIDYRIDKANSVIPDQDVIGLVFTSNNLGSPMRAFIWGGQDFESLEDTYHDYTSSQLYFAGATHSDGIPWGTNPITQDTYEGYISTFTLDPFDEETFTSLKSRYIHSTGNFSYHLNGIDHFVSGLVQGDGSNELYIAGNINSDGTSPFRRSFPFIRKVSSNLSNTAVDGSVMIAPTNLQHFVFSRGIERVKNLAYVYGELKEGASDDLNVSSSVFVVPFTDTPSGFTTVSTQEDIPSFSSHDTGAEVPLTHFLDEYDNLHLLGYENRVNVAGEPYTIGMHTVFDGENFIVHHTLGNDFATTTGSGRTQIHGVHYLGTGNMYLSGYHNWQSAKPPLEIPHGSLLESSDSGQKYDALITSVGANKLTRNGVDFIPYGVQWNQIGNCLKLDENNETESLMDDFRLGEFIFINFQEEYYSLVKNNKVIQDLDLMEAWGFNAVRTVLDGRSMGPPLDASGQPSLYIQNLADFTSKAKQRGIVVLLTIVQIPHELFLPGVTGEFNGHPVGETFMRNYHAIASKPTLAGNIIPGSNANLTWMSDGDLIRTQCQTGFSLDDPDLTSIENEPLMEETADFWVNVLRGIRDEGGANNLTSNIMVEIWLEPTFFTRNHSGVSCHPFAGTSPNNCVTEVDLDDSQTPSFTAQSSYRTDSPQGRQRLAHDIALRFCNYVTHQIKTADNNEFANVPVGLSLIPPIQVRGGEIIDHEQLDLFDAENDLTRNGRAPFPIAAIARSNLDFIGLNMNMSRVQANPNDPNNYDSYEQRRSQLALEYLDSANETVWLQSKQAILNAEVSYLRDDRVDGETTTQLINPVGEIGKSKFYTEFDDTFDAMKDVVWLQSYLSRYYNSRVMFYWEWDIWYGFRENLADPFNCTLVKTILDLSDNTSPNFSSYQGEDIFTGIDSFELGRPEANLAGPLISPALRDDPVDPDIEKVILENKHGTVSSYFFPSAKKYVHLPNISSGNVEVELKVYVYAEEVPNPNNQYISSFSKIVTTDSTIEILSMDETSQLQNGLTWPTNFAIAIYAQHVGINPLQLSLREEEFSADIFPIQKSSNMNDVPSGTVSLRLFHPGSRSMGKINVELLENGSSTPSTYEVKPKSVRDIPVSFSSPFNVYTVSSERNGTKEISERPELVIEIHN